jgi:hypothetical protein
MLNETNTINYKISKALLALNPNAQWVLIGDNYDDIEWLSEDNKPTWAQVEAEINNPTPISEPTVVEKLASVGLNLDDLKAALGL